jgi:NTP pyrophosphatase (non-canonical NTP hydrolase)
MSSQALRFTFLESPPKIMPMELKTLEIRMHEFVASKGWYEADSPKPQTPRNLAASIAIEAAEILEHFQWRESSSDSGELAGELADVALYLLQLASVTGIDLEQAILDKLAQNQTRTWPAP